MARPAKVLNRSSRGALLLRLRLAILLIPLLALAATAGFGARAEGSAIDHGAASSQIVSFAPSRLAPIDVAAGQMCNWGGTWKGNDGDQTLTMTVDPRTGAGTVRGRWSGWTSSDATNDSFQGSVRGDATHLDSGTWYNGNHGGTMDYTMSPDCNSFSGSRYECYQGGTPVPAGQSGPQAPRFCNQGNYAPMQINYQRSGGSSTVPAAGSSTGGSSSPTTGGASSSSGTTTTSTTTTTTSGTPNCNTLSVGVAPPAGCPPSATPCTYGGQPSAGFPCVPCPGGGNAAFLSECPQAQTCNTGVTYAPTGCVKCPGGSTAATLAQCPQSVSCDLGGVVSPPAGCVTCPGSTQTAVSQSACPHAQLPCSDGTTSETQCSTCTDNTTTADTCRSCTDGSTTALSCTSCTDGTTTSNTCTSCTDGTSTAQACRLCTDGTSTSRVCSSCNDGTTANQCTACTDGTNSVNNPCPTTCPDGSTTAKPQCPPPGPKPPDPCPTEQAAFAAADVNAHSLQDALQTQRNLQKYLDDQYNVAVLKAAGKYGVAAAFAVASVGSSSIYGILGWSSAVSTAQAAIVETTAAALGQGLATQAIQSVANQGLNFGDLASTVASKDAKQAVLRAMQDYLTSQQMQNYLSTSGASVSGIAASSYDSMRSQVDSNYGTMTKNLGSALTLLSLSGASSAQSNIDAIRALDNQVTGDISTQEQQLQSALDDLGNARDALNYCRQQHPDNGSGS